MTELLAGRYDVGAVLRTMAFTVEYRAWDTQLYREVAVTMLRKDLVRDAAAVGLFAATVSVGAELTHPGIAGVFDAGVSEFDEATMRWAVGELIDAPNIDGLRPQPEQAEHWNELMLVAAEQLAEVMQSAHSDGVVHGNLGPATVLLDANGHDGSRVRVTGFGPQAADLAVLSDPQLTVRMWQMFTEHLEYPSPEQRDGMAPTRRSDVFGFGCVLSALLLLAPVPEVSVPTASVPDEIPVTLPGVDVDTRQELWRIAQQAMSEKPGDRQYSFAVVRDQLRWIRVARHLAETDATAERADTLVLPFLPTAPESAPKTEELRYLLTRPLPPPPRKRRSPRRRRIAAMLSAAALILGVGLYIARPGPSPAADSITIPAVTGQSIESATRLLGTLGLRLSGQLARTDPTVAPGLVAGTEPAAGSQVPTGQSVTIVVSTGPDLRTVPQLQGLTLTAAQDALTTGGFAAGEIRHRDGLTVAGIVLDSDPAFGQSVDASTPVALIVSSGNQTIPRGLLGQSGGAAAQALSAAGFAAQTLKQARSDIAPGLVIEVNPGVGGSAPLGSIVTLTISEWLAPSVAPSLPPTPVPGTTPQPLQPSPASSPPVGQVTGSGNKLLSYTTDAWVT